MRRPDWPGNVTLNWPVTVLVPTAGVAGLGTIVNENDPLGSLVDGARAEDQLATRNSQL
jgi:hypothetical protein